MRIEVPILTGMMFQGSLLVSGLQLGVAGVWANLKANVSFDTHAEGWEEAYAQKLIELRLFRHIVA